MLPQPVDTPTLFINRHEQVELIVEKLHDIRSGRLTSDFLITVIGIPGIGKTSLLHESARQAQKFTIPSVFIDYKIEAYHSPVQTLDKIASGFFGDSPDWSVARRTYQSEKINQATWGNLLSQFIRIFVTKLTSMPLLLLIDNADKIWDNDDYPGLRATLESVIEQGGKQHRLLAITATRVFLDWENAELRRQAVSISLMPFEREETTALLSPEVEDYQVLTDQIYTVTHGYPKASVLAFQWAIEHLKASPRKDLNNLFAAHEEDLIFKLFEDIIKQYILINVQDADRRQRLRTLLRYVSPLRRFDDTLLADLLPQIAPEIFPEITTARARVYIFDVATETHLVSWDSARQAYVLDTSMRHFLALELKYRESERLKLIHKLAYEWYDHAMAEVVRSSASSPQSVLYLNEFIYHFASHRALTNKRSTLVADIQVKIAGLFSGYVYRERNHFKEEFVRDNELAELLGRQAYGKLRQFVEEQINPD